MTLRPLTAPEAQTTEGHEEEPAVRVVRDEERAEPRQVARLASDGLLLGREPWRSPQPVVEQLPSEPRLRAPRFEVHRRARNPLFEHLFEVEPRTCTSDM